MFNAIPECFKLNKGVTYRHLLILALQFTITLSLEKTYAYPGRLLHDDEAGTAQEGEQSYALESLEQLLEEPFPMLNRGIAKASENYQGCESLEENYNNLYLIRKRIDSTGEYHKECQPCSKHDSEILFGSRRKYIFLCPAYYAAQGVKEFTSPERHRLTTFSQCLYETTLWLRKSTPYIDYHHSEREDNIYNDFMRTQRRLPQLIKDIAPKDLQDKISPTNLLMPEVKKYQTSLTMRSDRLFLSDFINDIDYHEYQTAKHICFNSNNHYLNQFSYLQYNIEFFLPSKKGLHNVEDCSQQTTNLFQQYEKGYFYRKFVNIAGLHQAKLIRQACTDYLNPEREPNFQALSCDNLASYQFKGLGSITSIQCPTCPKIKMINTQLTNISPTACEEPSSSEQTCFNASLTMTSPDNDLGHLQYARSMRMLEELAEWIPGKMDQARQKALEDKKYPRKSHEILAYIDNADIQVTCAENEDKAYPELKLKLKEDDRVFVYPELTAGSETKWFSTTDERKGSIYYPFEFETPTGKVSFTIKAVKRGDDL